MAINPYKYEYNVAEESPGGNYAPYDPYQAATQPDTDNRSDGTNAPQDYTQEINVQPGFTGSPEAPRTNNNSATTAPATEDWTQGTWDEDRVRRYFASRGVTPNATSPAYWVQKWNEWGSKDPAYFLRRLAAADEIIGGPENSPFKESAGSGSSASSSSTASSQPDHSAQWDQLYNLLLGRAQQSLNVNAHDPIIAGQVNSYRADQTRDLRNTLAQLAERQGPNSNLNSEQRQGNEQVRQSAGNLQSQLVSNELTARRTEIQNALSQMGSMLSASQTLALQQQLGLIDAALRQQQITNQNNQFNSNLGFQVSDRAAYYDWLRSNPGANA
jgi:hypothetical protein